MKKFRLPRPEPGFYRIPPFDSSAGENETADACIEQYLDHVFTPLHGEIANDVLAERQLEMKAHIEELADAHEKRLGRLAAVEWALGQLGSPKSITKAWRKELNSGHEATPRALRFVEIAVSITAGCSWVVLGGQYAELVRPMLFWLPLLAGLTIGLVAHSRPVVRTLSVQSALCGPMLALNFGVLIWPRIIQEARDQGLQTPSYSSAVSTLAHSLTIPGTVLLLLALGIWWIGMSCAGAAIGNQMRRRYIRKRLA